MGEHEGLSRAITEGPVVSKVEEREGDMAGMAERVVKGGKPRARSDGGMTGPLLCCKMVRGEAQCTEKPNDRTDNRSCSQRG